MHTNNQQKSEDRRRGWTITITFHSLLLLLALIPFMIEEKADNEFTRAIAIQFEDSSTKQSGRAQAGSASRAAREQVAMANLQPRQAVNPMSAPTQREILTGPDPDVQMRPRDNFFDSPVEVNEVQEVDEVQEMVDAQPQNGTFEEWSISDAEEYSDAPAPLSNEAAQQADGNRGGKGTGNSEWYDNLAGDAEHGSEDPFADGFFTDDWPGEGDGDTGRNLGVGNDGQGRYWGDFAGDGLFNRKVIKRANVARLAVKQGKVVVKLCVNQIGEVVYAKFDAANSTLNDPTLITKSEDCARHYVFDEDPTAPREQCGKLTFIFKIDD